MATELSDEVWQLELGGGNAYFVDEDDPTLVDTGRPWDADTLRRELDAVGVEIADIERVLLTHYDFDNVGALAALEPELTATVYAGAFDAAILGKRRTPPLTNHKGAIQRLAGFVLTFPSLEIVPVDDGETIGTFTVHHTPGHTPGHVAYVSTEKHVGFLGDLVSEVDGSLHRSTWLESYDTGDVRESIVRLSREAPDFDMACVGHGETIRDGGSDALDSVARELSG